MNKAEMLWMKLSNSSPVVKNMEIEMIPTPQQDGSKTLRKGIGILPQATQYVNQTN